MGNFSFRKLASGTYTITPNKAGYTFSPGSLTVSFNGTSVSGLSFTATPGSGSPSPVVSISLTPVTSTVVAGGTVQFSAAVSGSSNTAVTWSVTGGSISPSGLFTAPSTSGTYTVKATSAADSTKSATATVAVTTAPTVAVSISPTSATIKTGGTQQFAATVSGNSNTAVTWSATGGSITSTGLYTAPSSPGSYTVTAKSVADSTKSASAKVSVPASSCLLASPTWLANPLGVTETGAFTVSFDATPQANNIDADVALSQNVPGAYTDLAAIVRFNPSGYIDAMKGAAYAADYSQPYTANSTYHFVVNVNLGPNMYTVYVTPPGGTQQILATNYAFRSEQASIASLSYWTTYQDPFSTGTVQACNFSLASGGVPPSVAVAVSPTQSSLQPGGTQQFTATVSGTSNTAVTWSASVGTISASGVYTAPSSAGTYSVKATSTADTTKSAAANVTVASTPAQIAVSPTAMSFPSITANTTSTQTLTLSNTGGSSFSVSNATVSGSAFSIVGASFPMTIGAGQSTSVGVRFAPTTTGSFTGSITIASNASNAAPAVALSGSATAASTYLLSASPTSVAFGNVVEGSSANKSVTLSNTGTGSVSISAANFTGMGYSLSGAQLPMTIAAGKTQNVTISFSPQTSGPASGTVSFVSNATNSPTTVSLSGSGTVPVQHSVDLSWNASTSTVSGYNIYRGSVSGGPYIKLTSSPQVGTTYVDSTVQSGATYYYVVTAVNSSGQESANSNETSAVIPNP